MATHMPTKYHFWLFYDLHQLIDLHTVADAKFAMEILSFEHFTNRIGIRNLNSH
jgi:hypothetical protein